MEGSVGDGDGRRRDGEWEAASGKEILDVLLTKTPSKRLW